MNRKIILVILFLVTLQLFNPVKAQEEISQQPEFTPLDYNFLDTTRIPIYLSITNEISTDQDLIDGQTVDFRVIKDVKYNNKTILKQGQIVQGKLEIIVTAGMNGFPAEIYIDEFTIPGIKNSQLMSTYIKKGQNRCFWVYPLKWALTPIPFVGSLTNLIMGGHAKIKTSDIITIYYYPKWL